MYDIQHVLYTIGTSVFQNAAKATLVRVAISPVLPAPLVSCVVVNVFQSAVEKIATMSVDVQMISKIHQHKYTQVYTEERNGSFSRFYIIFVSLYLAFQKQTNMYFLCICLFA